MHYLTFSTKIDDETRNLLIRKKRVYDKRITLRVEQLNDCEYNVCFQSPHLGRMPQNCKTNQKFLRTKLKPFPWMKTNQKKLEILFDRKFSPQHLLWLFKRIDNNLGDPKPGPPLLKQLRHLKVIEQLQIDLRRDTNNHQVDGCFSRYFPQLKTLTLLLSNQSFDFSDLNRVNAFFQDLKNVRNLQKFALEFSLRNDAHLEIFENIIRNIDQIPSFEIKVDAENEIFLMFDRWRIFLMQFDHLEILPPQIILKKGDKKLFAIDFSFCELGSSNLFQEGYSETNMPAFSIMTQSRNLLNEMSLLRELSISIPPDLEMIKELQSIYQLPCCQTMEEHFLYLIQESSEDHMEDTLIQGLAEALSYLEASTLGLGFFGFQDLHFLKALFPQPHKLNYFRLFVITKHRTITTKNESIIEYLEAEVDVPFEAFTELKQFELFVNKLDRCSLTKLMNDLCSLKELECLIINKVSFVRGNESQKQFLENIRTAKVWLSLNNEIDEFDEREEGRKGGI